jgi:hypothetical protein
VNARLIRSKFKSIPGASESEDAIYRPSPCHSICDRPNVSSIEQALPATLMGLSSFNSSPARSTLIGMSQAVSFLRIPADVGVKIPTKSMFLVQFVGTVNVGVAYCLLHSVENICNGTLLLRNSPWTCPNDRVFFNASVIRGSSSSASSTSVMT